MKRLLLTSILLPLSARGVYTFGSHLKWTWAIGLGYVASIAAHLSINANYF